MEIRLLRAILRLMGAEEVEVVAGKNTSEYIAALAEPWHSYIGEIDGLTPNLERDFRMGGKIDDIGEIDLPDVFKKTGYLFSIPRTGRKGTEEIRLATEEEFRAYEEWIAKEGFPQESLIGAKEHLEAVLHEQKIGLHVKNPQRNPNSLYRITLDVLSALPESHLRSASFRGLDIGVEGSRSTTSHSEYDHRRVRMFDVAVRGAVRNYIAVLCHEIGHSFHSRLKRKNRAQMRLLADTYKIISGCNLPGDDIPENHKLFGVDYFSGAEARIEEQCDFPEFVAEMYMAYVLTGGKLRGHIREQKDAYRLAWQAAYSIFRNNFDGVEFRQGKPSPVEQSI